MISRTFLAETKLFPFSLRIILAIDCGQNSETIQKPHQTITMGNTEAILFIWQEGLESIWSSPCLKRSANGLANLSSMGHFALDTVDKGFRRDHPLIALGTTAY